MKINAFLPLFLLSVILQSLPLYGKEAAGSAGKRVVIVGAGSIGLMSAYFLYKDGFDVTVLDREEPASGASFGNAGFIVPSSAYPLAAPGMVRQGLSRMLRSGAGGMGFENLHYPSTLRWAWHFWRSGTEKQYRETSDILFSLGQESSRLHKDIASMLGGSIYQQSGRLELTSSEEAFEDSRAKARRLKERGIVTSEVTGDAVRELIPHTLPASAVKGVFYPGDGYIRPYVLLKALADWLRERGVIIRGGVKVTDFRTDARKVTGLMTNDGLVKGDEFLIAAGFESNGLIKKARARSLVLLPGAGYSLTIKNPGVHVFKPVMLADHHVAVTPLDQNRLRVAGVMVMGDYSRKHDRSKVDFIKGVIRTWFGEDFWEQNPDYTTWKGHRPCSPDGLPMVGRLKEYQNLSVATGHCTLGMHFGPVTGRIVSSVLSGRPLSNGEQKLRPQRY